MKKIIPIIAIILIISQVLNKNNNTIIIPSSAIRLRIIASSNTTYDQYMKQEVRKILENEISNTLTNVKDIETSREIITTNLNTYKTKITNLFKEKNYQEDISINFGINYFPSKYYKGIEYKEGEYESLVITIGKGLGDNWWCVLFPPLCLLESEENTEIEYKFKVVELLENIFD